MVKVWPAGGCGVAWGAYGGGARANLAAWRRPARGMGEEWPPRVYSERCRRLRHALARAAGRREERGSKPAHVLGVELKVGRKASVPRSFHGRYLAVFARAGCAEVAVPYDITKISHLADRLEQGFERALLFAEHLAEGRADTFRARLRRFIVEEVRREVEGAGAGAAVPQFSQSTRQRPPRA